MSAAIAPVDDARELGTPLASRDVVLERLIAVGTVANAIDPRAHDDDDAASARIAVELQQLLERALALLVELRVIEDEASDPVAPVFELVEDDDAERPPTLSPPRLANVCFAGGFELGRVLRELASARGGAEQRVAAETARRKLLRCARAVLDAAPALPGDLPAWVHPAADLQAALGVRRLYAELRRQLRRAASDDADAVLTAVRYAAGAIATLCSAPAYADVRASDRALLRRLHERAIEWARNDRGVQSGLRLLDDFWTTADLLRGIDRRQELRAHDATLLRSAAEGPGTAFAEWLVVLEALVGLDDELDAAVRALRQGPESAAAIARITRRARELW